MQMFLRVVDGINGKSLSRGRNHFDHASVARFLEKSFSNADRIKISTTLPKGPCIKLIRNKKSSGVAYVSPIGEVWGCWWGWYDLFKGDKFPNSFYVSLP